MEERRDEALRPTRVWHQSLGTIPLYHNARSWTEVGLFGRRKLFRPERSQVSERHCLAQKPARPSRSDGRQSGPPFQRHRPWNATLDPSRRLVPGQHRLDDKPNEIAAFLALLSMLALEDCTVTVDTMGCRKRMLGPTKSWL